MMHSSEATQTIMRPQVKREMNDDLNDGDDDEDFPEVPIVAKEKRLSLLHFCSI
jgi:hypothetical protein